MNIYSLALLIVGLNIGSSIVLKTLADQTPKFSVLITGFSLVALLNIFRMVAWYFANRNFPLSQFHPLTSLIFPAMALVALAYGEEIGYPQIGGVLLICMGVVLMEKNKTGKLIKKKGSSFNVS